MDGKWVGDQYYYGGVGAPDGFGHGHYNENTGYNRPAMNDQSVTGALGWTAIMQPGGNPPNKHNIDIGGTPF